MSQSAGARYRLLRQIGAGGMAQVVEAVATGPGGFERRVAIKWMLPEIANDASARGMFLDEARIASELHHANIVQIVDYGLMDGSEFIVYEFVDGLDLTRACSQQSGTVKDTVALHVVSEVAHALDHAHRRRDAGGHALAIVHRDVSPSNVLLSWDGDVKLADFGIAFAAHKEERTATGLIKGKASYMAPEQAEGKQATGAADVYALGVTLHRLLTGESPSHYGRRVAGEDQRISPDLEKLVNAALAVEPEARPTARAFAEEAGKLRASRTSTSGRRELEEWLRPLKELRTPPRRLDQFAGEEVVEDTPGSRTFRIVSQVTEDERAPDRRDSTTRRQRSTVTIALLSGFFTACLSSGAFIAYLGFQESGSEASVSGRDSPRADVRLSVDASPDATLDEAGVTGDATTDAEAAIERRRVRARGAPPPPPSPSPPPVARDLYISVGGAASGKRVFIDGRFVGWAPQKFTVSRPGSYRVVIRGRDTPEVISEQTVVVTADNDSRSNAARFHP
ncbi:MAG: serine/threonine-protein kinase [Myxococcota bacterium]